MNTGDSPMAKLIDRDEWRKLPDFLTLPAMSNGVGLCKFDLLMLRKLQQHVALMEPGNGLTTREVLSLARLHHHQIIQKIVEGSIVAYGMTSLATKIIRANASFKAVSSKEGEHA